VKKAFARIRARLQSLRKNPHFDGVLKGRGFSRAVSAAKSAAALAAGEIAGLEKTFFAACSGVPWSRVLRNRFSGGLRD
jgi:hypothetical protein